MSEDHDLFDEAEEESIVHAHLLRYKGVLYSAEKVEITKDTVFFQVDAQLVRRGIFPKNRIDMRWFEELGIEYCPVYQAPIQEQ